MTLLDALINEDINNALALIEAGADLNIVSKLGSSPLIVACYRNNIVVVMALIKAGVDLDIVNLGGSSPLIMACSNNNTEVALALIKAGANVNIVDQNGNSALTIACENGMSEVVLALIKAGAIICRDEDSSKLNESAQRALELPSNMESFTLNEYSSLPLTSRKTIVTIMQLRSVNPFLRMLPNELLQEIFRQL